MYQSFGILQNAFILGHVEVPILAFNLVEYLNIQVKLVV